MPAAAPTPVEEEDESADDPSVNVLEEARARRRHEGSDTTDSDDGRSSRRRSTRVGGGDCPPPDDPICHVGGRKVCATGANGCMRCSCEKQRQFLEDESRTDPHGSRFRGLEE